MREQNRAKEQGGLSGRPLFRLSTRMVAETYVRAEGAFPLIGVGGIDSGGAALTKIRAGASLIQLYSSLVYKGLGLVESIKSDLASTLLRTGREQLSEIVGADAATITAEDWPVKRQHVAERRPEQRRIAQRLQAAAGGVVHAAARPTARHCRTAAAPARRRERSRATAPSDCACRAPRSRR